jgi:HEPN domain-containing protein
MKEMQDSIHPPDWIRIAEKDLQRVKKMLELNDPEASGFFMQQSLEKYLKAFLLHHGWKLKKIHNLYTLLDDAIKHRPTLEKYRGLCERVSGYYFSERYPALIDSELTCEDIEKDINEAEKFINELKME